MESFRKLLTEGSSEAKELKDIVNRLQDMKERVSKHALNNHDSTITKTIDDGVLIGKLEDAIRILAPEVFLRSKQ